MQYSVFHWPREAQAWRGSFSVLGIGYKMLSTLVLFQKSNGQAKAELSARVETGDELEIQAAATTDLKGKFDDAVV